MGSGVPSELIKQGSRLSWKAPSCSRSGLGSENKGGNHRGHATAALIAPFFLSPLSELRRFNPAPWMHTLVFGFDHLIIVVHNYITFPYKHSFSLVALQAQLLTMLYLGDGTGGSCPNSRETTPGRFNTPSVDSYLDNSDLVDHPANLQYPVLHWRLPLGGAPHPTAGVLSRPCLHRGTAGRVCGGGDEDWQRRIRERALVLDRCYKCP